MKKIISLILTICLITSICAFMPISASAATSGTCGDNLTWTLDDEGTLTISGTGDMYSYDYTSMPWYDFQTDIKNIVINSGVTSIGSYTFCKCSSLTSVTIPNSVTYIGYSAFEECGKLTSITIPNSVMFIGGWAFDDCDNLTSITIPNGVTGIDEATFESCDNLTSVTLPGSITSIGDSAFKGCKKLTNITIPNSVTSIGMWAFNDCDSLTSITIPDSVLFVGFGAFWFCDNLSTVSIGNGITIIAKEMFSYCENLTDVTIGNGVTNIEEKAFEGCKTLTSIIIPDGITMISEKAFFYCSSLTNISVSSSNSKYASENGVLFNKNKTKLICYPVGISGVFTIPNSVTSIGDYAFYECDSVTSVIIPDSVTSIGSYAFCNCDSLTDVYYCGSEIEWNNISILSGNTDLKNATIHYNYNPNDDNNSDENSKATFYIDNEYCIENNNNDVWGSVAISGNTQNIEDITDNIIWKSSDTSVAEIEQVSYINAEDEKSATIDIKISGHKIGKATITGTTADGRTATATVSVEPKLTALTLNYDEGAVPETIKYEISTASNNREYFDDFLSKLSYTGLFDDSSVSYVISSDNKNAVVSITTKLLVGDNTITVTSDCGQTADIKVSVKENLDFTLGRDNQKFSHSTFNFFEDTEIKTKLYPVSEKYYKAWEKMIEQGIITEKQYLDLVNYSNKEGVPYDYNKNLHDWGGACFGLATTLLSSFDNLTTKLKYMAFDSNATCFYDISSMPKNNTELRDVINFYHPLQSYIKFSAGMYNDLIGLGQSLYGADWTTDKENFWDSLADAASNIHTGPITPLMLCYLEKSGSGHVIIICDFEETENEYKFEFYDVNSVSTTTSLTGSMSTFTVNKNDYSFDLVDANNTNIYEEWRCLKYYNALDIQSLIGSINYVDENYSVLSKSITKNENNVTFKFKSDSSFTLTNEKNEKLTYDNGVFDSDMTVYDFDFESNGNGSYITLTLDNDNTYVYTSSDTSNFTIYNNDMYYSCNSQGTDMITITENSIKFAGDTITADVTVGLDKELVNISGKAVDNIDLTLDDEIIKCESANTVSDIVVSTIHYNEKTEENIENTDNFEISVKDDSDSNDNGNNNGNNSSGGGGGSSTTNYTVKFETNGGSTIDSVKVTRNNTVAEPTAPTKDGFEFAGWYTDKALTTAYDFDTKVTASITLYAAWNEKKDETVEPTEPTTPENKIAFTDVKENDWFAENVKFVVENGLMNGTSETEFAPNDNLTRAMLVAILYRADGEPAVNKSIPFADVTADSYYANAVIWAQQNGIVSGVNENEFAPDENITREQIATIVYRYANYKGYDTSAKADLSVYADADEISEYAVDAMQYAVGSGLIKGKTETTLNPQDNATRAEIAAILQRFIEANK